MTKTVNFHSALHSLRHIHGQNFNFLFLINVHDSAREKKAEETFSLLIRVKGA